MRKLKNNNHELYNICSNKPVGLKKVVNFIGKFTPKTKMVRRKKQLADIYKTHGNNKKILKKIKNFKFTELEVSIKNTIDWFKNNKHLFD